MAKKKQQEEVSFTLFQKVETYFESHPKLLIYLPLLIAFIFGILLFNLRLDEGGDDSAYINRAADFIQDGKFPAFQGPIYPLFLASVITIFGIKLPLLKFTSLIFMLASIFFFTRALKGRVPHLVLFVSVILLGINSYILNYASQTYSEALFMMLQALFFWRFFRYFDKYSHKSDRIDKSELIELLILGGLLFLVFQTRTIGAVLIISAAFIFLLKVKFKELAIVLVTTIVLFGGIKVVEFTFQKNGAEPQSQLSTLTYKHPYDLKEGKEDFGGYLMRIVDNSNLYIGKQFLKIVGVKAATNKEYSVVFTIVFYLVMGAGFWYIFRKNHEYLFLLVYAALALLGTFVSIQKIWDQYRLIVPYVPIILLLLSLFIYTILSNKSFKELQITFLILFASITVLVFVSSSKKFEVKNLVANLTINKYQGYTPDWENYLKLAEYASNTLPSDSYIAVRKPDMARIYCNGKKFYGIFRFNSDNADELVKQLKDAKVTHIILASLRKNPEVNSGDVINTLHRYMTVIIQKYPKAFTELKSEGGTNEPAALYKVNYENIN